MMSKRKRKQSVKAKESAMVNQWVSNRKKKLPVQNEIDSVQDFRLDKIIDVKFATLPERVQMWIDEIENYYPENASVTENLNGEVGKQIKLLHGDHKGTIIEIFYDTGTIVVKGKSPQFIDWAEKVFPEIRKKLPKIYSDSSVNCSQNDVLSEENKVEESVNENEINEKLEKNNENDTRDDEITIVKEIVNRDEKIVGKNESMTDLNSKDESTDDTKVMKLPMREFIKTALSSPIRKITPIEQISKDVESIKSSICHLEKAVSVIPELKEIITNDNSVLKNSCSDLEKDNSILKLKQVNENQQKEIASLKEKNSSLSKEVNGLKSSMVQMLQDENDTLKNAKSKHDKLEKEIESLKKKNEACKTLQDNYDKLMKENEYLKSQNCVSHDSLQDKCEKLEKEIESL